MIGLVCLWETEIYVFRMWLVHQYKSDPINMGLESVQPNSLVLENQVSIQVAAYSVHSETGSSLGIG